MIDPGNHAALNQFEHATADEAIVELYRTHYAGLVRLSALLLGDAGAAEEIVQDAFVAVHGSWNRLRDPDRALGYLRQAVVNRSRSNLRHRTVVAKYQPAPPPDVPSAETYAVAASERAEVLAALRALPRRQRETLVLRYSRLEPEERRLPTVAQDYTRWFLARARVLGPILAEREYLCAGRFTAADISVGYALMFAHSNGLAAQLTPAVADYWARLKQRDGFRKAIAAQDRAGVEQGVAPRVPAAT